MKNEIITAPLASATPVVSTHLPVAPRILRRNPLAHLMSKPDERVTNSGISITDKMELSAPVLSNAA